jgi:pimeloyl-ACP methyl ester carboxylesterase
MAGQRPDLAALRYFNEHLAPRYDLRGRLHEIQVPTLILNGAADFFGPRVSGRELSAIPNSRLVMLSGCGHWPFVETPDRFRAELEAFLTL